MTADGPGDLLRRQLDDSLESAGDANLARMQWSPAFWKLCSHRASEREPSQGETRAKWSLNQQLWYAMDTCMLHRSPHNVARGSRTRSHKLATTSRKTAGTRSQHFCTKARTIPALARTSTHTRRGRWTSAYSRGTNPRRFASVLFHIACRRGLSFHCNVAPSMTAQVSRWRMWTSERSSTQTDCIYLVSAQGYKSDWKAINDCTSHCKVLRFQNKLMFIGGVRVPAHSESVDGIN